MTMASEAKILRFPSADDKITCHVRVPNVSSVIAQNGDVPTGMSQVAYEMQQLAAKFDGLAEIFDECPEASFDDRTIFLDGHYTFVFQVPRRYAKLLMECGWHPDEVDVEELGRVDQD